MCVTSSLGPGAQCSSKYIYSSNPDLLRISCVEEKNPCFLKMLMNALTELSSYLGAPASRRTHNALLSRQKKKKDKQKDEGPVQMFSSLTAYFRTGNKDFLPIQIALFLWKLIHRHVERHTHKVS